MSGHYFTVYTSIDPTLVCIALRADAANNVSNQPLLPFVEFYNSSLDHLDLMTEYSQWLNDSGKSGGYVPL